MQKVGNVTVILNGYRRPHVLNEQYKAVMAQTIQPAEVFFWKNNSPYPAVFPQNVIDNCVSFIGNNNLGVWARFSIALMAKTKYVCVFDDDTIPGPRWIENCIISNKKQRGLYGTIGVVFANEIGYDGKQHRIGWDAPNTSIEKVDIVGHSWFFEKELLTAFWRELPDPKFTTAGEDIHFSYSIQKYLNLNTYVPPHPPDDKSLWGSDPILAIKYGGDANATAPHAIPLMNEYVKICRSKGFKFLFEEEK